MRVWPVFDKIVWVVRFIPHYDLSNDRYDPSNILRTGVDTHNQGKDTKLPPPKKKKKKKQQQQQQMTNVKSWLPVILQYMMYFGK
jgi:hypothetical protein